MKQATVLIVDDERGPRESLRMILKNDYQLLIASNGFEAIEFLKNHPVDVIVSDLKMPELSGVDVLNRAKELDPRIEFILLTGFGNLQSISLETPHPISDFLYKPYSVEIVRSVVKKAVEKRKSQS
ncbi:MAG: response regulator [Chlamydiae bacterium]|nr:response regulator [Chlamydiota bacterium]